MAALEKDMTERLIQVEEQADVPFPWSIISRVRSSFVCRNLLGALGVGMVFGVLAGGCMGATGTAMARLLKEPAINQTIFYLEKDINMWRSVKIQNLICMCLLLAILSFRVGVLGGLQAYNLARGPNHGDPSGKALAIAAPVAVLGVAVTGAAVGGAAGASVILAIFFIIIYVVAYFMEKYLSLLLITYGLSPTFCNNVNFLLFIFLYFLEFICNWVYSLTELVIFADMETLASLFFLSCLVGVCDKHPKFQFSRISVKVPAIVITTVVISRSVLRDGNPLVPLLDPAESRESLNVLPMLERFFIIVFGVQMFQASCASVLYSNYVTGGEGKVCAGAVAAGGGVVTVLLVASPILGAWASLGGLLGASGAAGVALSAAGDRGQRYGGYVGRAGAVVGAGVGAFLTLAPLDMKFAIQVALCAAAFPASPFIVLFVLDHIFTFLEYLSSKTWCWVLCGLAGVAFVCILMYIYFVFGLILCIMFIAFISRHSTIETNNLYY